MGSDPAGVVNIISCDYYLLGRGHCDGPKIFLESDIYLYKSYDWERVKLVVLLYYSERLCQLLRIHSKGLESEPESVNYKEMRTV